MTTRLFVKCVQTSGTADKNNAKFVGIKSKFTKNNFTAADFQVGGLVVLGGEAQNNPRHTSNNTVEVSLTDCDISNNQNPNFAVWGARNKGGTDIAGTDNSVTLELYGSTASATVQKCDSDPADPNRSNTVQITNGQVVPGC